MKPFLLGCLFALVCINAFGEEVNIELQKKEKEAGTRSLSFAPTATHAGRNRMKQHIHRRTVPVDRRPVMPE